MDNNPLHFTTAAAASAPMVELQAIAPPAHERTPGHNHPALLAGAAHLAPPSRFFPRSEAKSLAKSVWQKAGATEPSAEATAAAAKTGDKEDLSDPGRRGARDHVLDEAAPGDVEMLAFDQTKLEAAHARAKERLADVADAHAKAKGVGADIAAKGAHRTLLKKCLGVALAIVAVGLLAATTAGTGLIVVAAVKAALCVGDAVYARRTWKHHQAVANGDPQEIARHPLPKMGASVIANVFFDLATGCGAREDSAVRFGSFMQVLVTVGLVVAGFGCAGLPHDFLLQDPAALADKANEAPLEIADKADDVLKALLYGEQLHGAFAHGHDPQQENALHELQHRLATAREDLRTLAAGIANRRSAAQWQMDKMVAARPSDAVPGNLNDLRTRVQDFAQGQGVAPPDLANFNANDLRGWMGEFVRTLGMDELSELDEMVDVLARAEHQLHRHDSHAAAGLTYFLNCATYTANGFFG